MAFPTLVSSATTGDPTGSNPLIVNLPASIVSGNLLIVRVSTTTAGALTAPAGWTEFWANAHVGTASGDREMFIWRKADGSEGATLSITDANTVKFTALAWQFGSVADPAVTPPESTAISAATSTSTQPDAPSLSPSWGTTYDTMWLAVMVQEGLSTLPPNASPANYTNEISIDTGSGVNAASNNRMVGSIRQLNAASEDPGAWTMSTNDDWNAHTVAVPGSAPSGGGAPVGNLWLRGGL